MNLESEIKISNTNQTDIIYRHIKEPNPTPHPPQKAEAAEKVDTTAYIWYNIIIKYRRWYHG